MSESYSGYQLIIGHANYSPWDKILEEGTLETWASQNFSPIVASAIPVNPILRFLDQLLWKFKWNKRLGQFATLFEIVLKKFNDNKIPIALQKWNESQKRQFWEIQAKELDVFMLRKTLSVMKKFLDSDHEFLVLVTSTSYLNLPKLESEIALLPHNKKIAAGRINNHNGEEFPSGSFRIFSRELIKILLKEDIGKVTHLPEDLAIGRMIKDHHPQLIDLNSIDVPSVEAVENLTPYELNNTIHFRCKSGRIEERNDVEIMNKIHSKMKSLK